MVIASCRQHPRPLLHPPACAFPSHSSAPLPLHTKSTPVRPSRRRPYTPALPLYNTTCVRTSPSSNTCTPHTPILFKYMCPLSRNTMPVPEQLYQGRCLPHLRGRDHSLPTCAFMLAPSMYTWPPFLWMMRQISSTPSSYTPAEQKDPGAGACRVMLVRSSVSCAAAPWAILPWYRAWQGKSASA